MSVLEVLGIVVAVAVGAVAFLVLVWFRLARCLDCGARFYARNIYSPDRDPLTGRRELELEWRYCGWCPRCWPKHRKQMDAEVKQDLMRVSGFTPDDFE